MLLKAPVKKLLQMLKLHHSDCSTSRYDTVWIWIFVTADRSSNTRKMIMMPVRGYAWSTCPALYELQYELRTHQLLMKADKNTEKYHQNQNFKWFHCIVAKTSLMNGISIIWVKKKQYHDKNALVMVNPNNYIVW